MFETFEYSHTPSPRSFRLSVPARGFVGLANDETIVEVSHRIYIDNVHEYAHWHICGCTITYTHHRFRDKSPVTPLATLWEKRKQDRQWAMRKNIYISSALEAMRNDRICIYVSCSIRAFSLNQKKKKVVCRCQSHWPRRGIRTRKPNEFTACMEIENGVLVDGNAYKPWFKR